MKLSSWCFVLALSCWMGLGPVLLGCGSDDKDGGGLCENACNKNTACGSNEPFEECVAGCEAGVQQVKDCVAGNCSTDSACDAWLTCLQNCGVF